MELVVDILWVLVSIVSALAILTYATWLLVHRFRAGESKRLAFGEWIRNVLQAIWGL